MFELLIVEDDPRIAEIQVKFISLIKDFTVTGIAHTLEEARTQLPILKPSLVILDLHLPDGSGLELLDEIRHEYLDTDVIVITAAKEIESLQTAMRGGVFDYILKPMSFNRLQESLSTYLAHHNQKLQLQTDSTDVDFDQHFVDRMFSKIHINHAPKTLPKGVDINTLKIVKDYLSDRAEQSFNTQQLGDILGLCRTTARRYLEYLVSQNEAKTLQVYGTVGRPERRYSILVS